MLQHSLRFATFAHLFSQASVTNGANAGASSTDADPNTNLLVNEVDKIYKKIFINEPYKDKYDCVILCVSHNNYKKKSFQKNINTFCKKNYVIFDMKYFLDEKYYKGKYFTI